MKKGVNGSWDKISTHLTGTEFNFQFRTRHFDLLLICFGYFSEISPDGIDFQFGTDTFTYVSDRSGGAIVRKGCTQSRLSLHLFRSSDLSSESSVNHPLSWIIHGKPSLSDSKSFYCMLTFFYTLPLFTIYAKQKLNLEKTATVNTFI